LKPDGKERKERRHQLVTKNGKITLFLKKGFSLREGKGGGIEKKEGDRGVLLMDG